MISRTFPLLVQANVQLVLPKIKLEKENYAWSQGHAIHAETSFLNRRLGSEDNFVAWESQQGRVSVLTETGGQWKMRETELWSPTGAHEDSCWQLKGSRDGTAANQLYCYWKPNAVNKFCSLPADIRLSVALSHSLFITPCGTADELCVNILHTCMLPLYVCVCVCTDWILHTAQFTTSNWFPHQTLML